MLRARRLTPNEALPPQLVEFLFRDELRNSVPIEMLQRLRTQPEAHPQAALYVVEQPDASICLSAHDVPPHPPYVALGDLRAVPQLVAALRQKDVATPGLAGSKLMTDHVFRAWPELRSDLQRVERQALMLVDRVVLPHRAFGQHELARLQDLSLFTDWLQAFCQETGVHHRDLRLIRQDQKMRILAGDLHVLMVADRPVSMLVAGRKLRAGRSLGFVYTPPADRGRGYASQLVARVSQRVLEQGSLYCCLFTDLAHPVAKGLYERIGYRQLDEFCRYTPAISACPQQPEKV